MSSFNYTPKYVDNELDLKCAVKTSERVIIVKNQEMFEKLEAEVKKDRAAKTAKKVSGGVGKAGAAIGILGLLTIGLGLTPLIVGAAGIAGAVASGNLSKFKNYDAIIDYSEKRVIFLKTRGKAVFVVENDTIEGIDLKEIIKKNSEE